MLSKNTPKIHKQDYLLLLVILLIAAFLRFHRLADLMPFISDQGRDFLAAQEVLDTKTLPLLGIPSSVPRFKQGPIYVWVTSVLLAIGQGDPYVVGLFASATGLLAVGAGYIFTQKYFSKQAAVIVGLLLATSPLAITQSRLAFHTNPIPLISVFYLFSLYKLYKKPKNLYIPVLIFCILFQFELVVAPLFLLVPLTLWLKSYKPKRIELMQSGLALTVGLLPQILFDIQNNFQQLGLFIVWIVYRITGFAGFDSEHVTSTSKLSNVLTISFSYAQRFFSWFSSWPTKIILLVSSLMTITLLRPRRNPYMTILYSWIVIMGFSFLILGNASEAYFPVLFIPMAVAAGHSLTNLKITLLNKIALSSVLVISFFNIHFLMTNQFLTKTLERNPTNPFATYGPPIRDQIRAMSTLKQLGEPINMKTSDPNGSFPSYLDNYRYLAQWMDIEVSESGREVWINQSSRATRLNTRAESFGAINVIIPLNY